MVVANAPRNVTTESASRMGREALEIVRRRHYQAPSGRSVRIGDDIKAAKRGTVAYPPDAEIFWTPGPARATRIEVRNESTIAAAERLLAGGFSPVVLNFASATSPGGGFLTGARAQEESLMRSSALYDCLEGQDFYETHRRQDDPIYTDAAIYSPSVPFFRGDDHQLMETPRLIGVITCAAPNLWHRDIWTEAKLALVPGAFRRRIRRILAIGLAHGHDAIVLGAWGCGAFRNDPFAVARIFREVIDEFPGAYAAIDFAILDRTVHHEIIAPFERAFAQPSD